MTTAQSRIHAGTGASAATRAHSTLLPYFATMLGLNVLMHLVIAATGNRIGLLSGAMLAVVAILSAVYLLTAGRPLSRVRYGKLVAHVITYACVNVGFLVHAAVLLAMGAPAIQGEGLAPIDPRWIGATYVMAGFWGLGLICHLFGALMDRGFETAQA